MHELKQYLRERKIKQKDAAAALRVSETYLSKVLNGHWPVSHAFVGRVAMAYPAALPVVLGQESEGDGAASTN